MSRIVFDETSETERGAQLPVSVPSAHRDEKSNLPAWAKAAVFAGIGALALFMGCTYSRMTGVLISGFDFITGSVTASLFDGTGSMLLFAGTTLPPLICAGLLFFILAKKSESLERPLPIIALAALSAVLTLGFVAFVIGCGRGASIFSMLPGPGCLISLTGSVGLAVTAYKNSNHFKNRSGNRFGDGKGQISYLR